MDQKIILNQLQNTILIRLFADSTNLLFASVCEPKINLTRSWKELCRNLLTLPFITLIHWNDNENLHQTRIRSLMDFTQWCSKKKEDKRIHNFYLHSLWVTLVRLPPIYQLQFDDCKVLQLFSSYYLISLKTFYLCWKCNRLTLVLGMILQTSLCIVNFA